MKDSLLIKLFLSLTIAAIIASASAITKVYVHENDLLWIKKSLTRIEIALEKCGGK